MYDDGKNIGKNSRNPLQHHELSFKYYHITWTLQASQRFVEVLLYWIVLYCPGGPVIASNWCVLSLYVV